MSADDGHLVAAAIEGDQAALRRLIAAEYSQIWKICRRILGNNADADDATQETLIKVIRSVHSFDGRSKFSTWVYRIATNSSIDELRKRKRHLRAVSLDRVRDDGSTVEVADPSSAQAIEGIADRDAFDAALSAVDEDFRIPLVLRDVGTLSYQQIADQLELPIGTVKSRIARGRRQLLDLLNGDGNQPSQDIVQDTDPPSHL